VGHVVLVRHGRAAAAFDAHPDPGLDEVGARQAEEMAGALALFGPMPLYTSPLRRCRETAAALAARWGVEPLVDDGVGEIPTPDGEVGIGARGKWLDRVLHETWGVQADALQAWRQRVVDTVSRIGVAGDAVVVTHFVAVNAVVGAATGDDRVLCFSPVNCSRTEVRVDDDGRLHLVELGEQARTLVQ
jgi:broad specificity phosphatase PhoE